MGIIGVFYIADKLVAEFSGGNGLATTIGVLAIVMPWPLLIFLGLMLIMTVIARNPVLSLNISLLSLPVSAWFLPGKWLYLAFTISLIDNGAQLHPYGQSRVKQSGGHRKSRR